jgi:hypothetical protein
MRLDIKANTIPLMVDFNVTPSQPKRIRIVAFDAEKPHTRYTDRYVNIKGSRDFQLRFPKTPRRLTVLVGGVEEIRRGISDKTLKIGEAKIKRSKSCDAWIDSQTRSFLRFAEEFCEQSSYLKTGIYTSADNKFVIHYVPTIKGMDGKPLNTPARVGHQTGKIEVAQDKWLTYTVSMRMIILLHEYSHKYMNHQVGRDINDEVAADINALYIYLGNGYPAIDARLVFAYVFYGRNNDLNKRRMNIIDDYITKFQNGEVIKGCS